MVLESRPRSYSSRRDAHVYRDKRTGTRKLKDDPGGTGWEIAREALLCPACAAARGPSSPPPAPPPAPSARVARRERDIHRDDGSPERAVPQPGH